MLHALHAQNDDDGGDNWSADVDVDVIIDMQ